MINFKTWRTYLLPVIILSILLITGCRGCRDGTGEYTEPVLAPKVASTDPINGATGVATNKVITATFSKPMLASTIATTTFTVTESNGTIANGVVTYVGLIAYFTPAGSLTSNATFTAMISTGVKDTEGNALAANYTWIFQTGDAPDTEAPTVASTDPANGATGVASNKKIAITFSEGMSPTTIDSTTFTVTRNVLGATPVTGVATYVGLTAYFTPAANMATSASYTATITNGVKDLVGNAMTTNYSWVFTTGAGPDITAPTVTSTDPENGDTDVASNKKITAIFSEAMDAATINTTTFKVTGPGITPVTGIVTYAGLTANFSANLLTGTTYTATITTGAKDLANNILAADYTWTFTTGAAPDTVQPTVISTTPANGTENVAPNQALAAIFSEIMDSATISPTTFKVFQTTDPLKTLIPGTVTYVGLTANFIPTANLAFNTNYTATIASGAKDLAGLKLAASYIWTFTTGAAPDITAPTVTATNPANKATDVAINTKVAVTFSENMDSATMNNVTFTIKKQLDGSAVAGTVSYSGLIAQFTPTSILANSATYTATISISAKDLAGNAMAANYAWDFTTGALADTTRPTVISPTDPANNATNVATNKTISATFSEGMNSATINATTFTVKKQLDGSSIAGSVTYVGQTAYFDPTPLLESSATYTCTIASGPKDLAGNALVNKTWIFTTSAAPDTLQPTVIVTDPANAASDVAINTKVSATFSESMTAATINTTNFTITNASGTNVAGTVTYSSISKAATFDPSVDLAFNATYTARIFTGAKDLAGNAMATNYVWSFTTGALPDTTAPTVVVTSTDPAANETGVVLNKTLAVTFSEGMNSATINGSTFTLVKKVDGTAVAGAVSITGLIALFNPDADLDATASYTATITTGAKDLAGNALATNYVWEFQTGAALDVIAPTVLSTNPVINETGVAISKKIAVTFDESMEPTTIINGSFSVKKSDGTTVTGAVTYAGKIATFTPTSNLSYNATYTATINTVAEDLAGNALAANYVWSFHTGLSPDTTSPTVTSNDPAINESDVPFNKTIAVTFNETMASTTVTTNFTLVKQSTGLPVAGVVTYSGLIANFDPGADLDPTATYTATINSGIAGAKDLAGNALAANHSWNFTTSALPDTTSPTVVSPTDPANNAKGVATNKLISATFSESMNSATINDTTFTVKKQLDGSSIAGVVTYDSVSKTSYFDPTPLLESSATYTCTIATGPTDLAGNALVNKIWIFTTGAAPDTLKPTVALTDPVDKAANVAINTNIAAVFSENMDAATVNGTTFTVKNASGTAVAGAVSYNSVSKTVSFDPTSDLANSATYTATILTGVQDLAGNAMAVDYVWTFTTGVAPDTLKPTVTLTDPATNEIGVVFDKTIAVTFSEGMNSATINDTTFTLKKLGGASVNGAVTLTGLIAKFNPDVDLDPTATYTASIASGAKDLAGNALAASYTWDFQTGAAPDTLQPTVTSTDPIIGLTDVPLNQDIKATFSEDMDPTTINDTTFKIAGVTGIVSYDEITRIATFKLDAKLAINAVYTATIASGAKDLAGNSLNGNTASKDYVWTFTTGLRTLAKPVALGSAKTFGNFGGSAGMTNQGTLTQVKGDIGTTAASTLITGFHDSLGNVYTETPLNAGAVTGIIYTATMPNPPGTAVKAAACELDTQTAYNNLTPAALPGGVDVSAYGGGAGDLGNRTLKPGIYKSAPGSYSIQGGPLTLDGQNDANAVWVFQMASTLTVGGPGAAFPQSVILINGAQAKNVFWQVASAGTINAGGGGSMVGTIIAQAGVTFSTAGNVDIVNMTGRALSLISSVTLVNTVITLPAD